MRVRLKAIVVVAAIVTSSPSAWSPRRWRPPRRPWPFRTTSAPACSRRCCTRYAAARLERLVVPPTAAHPYPVVLVHGTFANMTDNWQTMSPLLANNGYCVFALDYGAIPAAAARRSTAARRHRGRRRGSSSAFVDRVLAATGASQGRHRRPLRRAGSMPDYYLEFLGGAAKVHTLVGLRRPTTAPTLDGLVALLAAASRAATPFLAACARPAQNRRPAPRSCSELNAGGDTVAGVKYTVIQTRYDEVVTPYTLGVPVAGTNVTNIVAAGPVLARPGRAPRRCPTTRSPTPTC